MDTASLLDKFKKDVRTGELLQHLASTQAKITAQGLIGSGPAFVAAAIFEDLKRHHLFLLSDKEEAAYFQNDLESLIGEEKVLHFPGSYRKSFKIGDLDNANIQMRAEALNRINKSEQGLVIVTYPEAICEKVLTRKTLVSNTVDVRVGEGLSIEFVQDFLLSYDFEQVDFVTEPGEFAIRGGIVDVFSFANDLPYRIEFFGDQIESIRSFEPATQLSVQPMHHITLIPNVQTKLLQENRDSLFNFIRPDTILWLKDTQFALQIIDNGYEKAVQERETENTLIAQLPAESIFENKTEIKAHLERFSVIELSKIPYFSAASIVIYKQQPQPSFNKNFKLLNENLNENTLKSFTNLIFTDSPRQTERIYAIFEDIGKETQFTAIPISIHEGFVDADLKLACYTDHQIFDRYHRYKLKKKYTKSETITLKELYSLKPGDFVSHIDHGIGRFGGLEKLEVNGKLQEAIRLVYRDNDILYVSIHSLHRITRYSGKEGTAPSLNKLGTQAWANLKNKTKKQVKDIAKDLIDLYAKRRAQKGFGFAPDTYMQTELEASFIYEDTPDQIKATRDFKNDMEKDYPMDRLVCGDVGFGKTEIAIRAAFKAVADSKQVAVLVPTTILALQHYKTFKARLKGLPCNIDYINRFKTAKQQTETLQHLVDGKLDIIIGTHRLLGKDIKFKDLGLMIIDEEQKFGVAAKEKLKALRVNVDSLTLTATPIPRTLQFSLMGARDLSIISTPPPNRYPVTTEVHTFDEKVIQEAIMYEVSRGGQVFFIHNRVGDIHDMAGLIERLCPGVKTCVGHGQMDGNKLEEVMMGFVDGYFDVLVATTIIESGLDIANANTIIINAAHNFGLSDLHQMRGRVGRSNKKAFCYLLAPPLTVLTNEARQRLTAIEQFSDLGSGFNIAMRDLDIRGAGNLLGGEQSGFISEIGFDMYHKILDEAIQELKENEYRELFSEAQSQEIIYVKDCQIDTDLEILIPDYYVNSITERLSLYKDLDDIDNEESLQTYERNLKDRFGVIPEPTLQLFDTIRLRWVAQHIGFEKLVLKNNKLLGYFVGNPQSPYYQSEAFTKVLQYIQVNKQVKLKELKDKLSLAFENVKTVKQALELIEKI